MNTMKPLVIVMFAAVLLTSGCGSMLQTRYERPEVTVPEAWQGTTTGGTATQQLQARWWDQFNDPQLSALIDRALASNNDLAAAAVRVRRAQLQSGLADTNLTPTVSVGADGSVSRALENGHTSRNSGASLSVGYEIDLWGKLARTRDASRWEAEATEFDRQAAALALIGTTAQLYWQIAALNEQIVMSEANLANGERTLALTQIQKDAGSVSALNVLQAEQSVASLQSGFENLQMQRDKARHALAVLFDQPPTVIETEAMRLPRADPPLIPEGVPAGVLSHRPDLAAAELRLRATLAEQDATRADFYPSFSLSGSLNAGGDGLREFLENPVAALGVRLALPFIQWNTTKLNLKVAETQYEEAVINFRKTFYTALLDVEDALSARRNAEVQHALQQTKLDAARRAEAIAEVRYRSGDTGVKEWLDAQDQRRSAEDAVVTNQMERLNAQMAVYQALGGSGDR